MPEIHPNVLTYLAAIDAFNRNDVAAVAEHVRPDFVYRIPGHVASAVVCRSVQGVSVASTGMRGAAVPDVSMPLETDHRSCEVTSRPARAPMPRAARPASVPA